MSIAMSRRAVLVGAAGVLASGTNVVAMSVMPAGADADLLWLGVQLDVLLGEYDRVDKEFEPKECWLEELTDRKGAICDQIGCIQRTILELPATTVAGLAVKARSAKFATRALLG